VAAFLAELRRRDIRVWTDCDWLRCNAPASVLTLELRDQLKRRKSEILEFCVRPGRWMRTSVFAVGGHNDEVFRYRVLVQHLDEDQPFFGQVSMAMANRLRVS